jgi:hypothetical protein
MDPAILGIAIGLSVLVSIGGLRYLCLKGEQPTQTINPLLIQKRRSSVRNLFV